MRRIFLTAIGVTVGLSLLLGLVYPLAVFGIGQVAFKHKAEGSFLTNAKGQVVGSSLLGQEFLDAKGNPDPTYFQPRPSAAGTGYDSTLSAASNLGPGDPRLVGFIPGLNIYDSHGHLLTGKTNPYATKDDPYCVPVDSTGAAILVPQDGTPVKVDGSYSCLSSTVPERVLAYRQLNGLSSRTLVPVDAVTGSFSGLDPDISIANADLQAPRVAKARHLPLATVLAAVKAHTSSRTLGVLGERGVNVLDLNLALDRAR